MKNKLADLNNHLFAQLERLSDEDLTREQLDQEIRRTEAIVATSTVIVRNADIALKAATLMAEYDGTQIHLPAMIEDKSK